MIFHFATSYVLEHEAPEDISGFRFTEWDSFLAFLSEKGFSYETKSEKHLAELKQSAREESYAIDQQISQLEKALSEVKSMELEENKSTLIDLIEKEIASRYAYEYGRIQIGLRNDLEVKEAIELIGDQSEYQKLLTNK